MGQRILIVDDNMDYYKTIARKLHANNYDVDIVCSNSSVSEYLNFNNYDLLIISLLTNKLEFLNFIRTIFPYVKIIVLVNDRNMEEELYILQLGVNHYLRKPVDFKVLLKYITTLLEETGGSKNTNTKYFLYDEAEKIEINLLNRSVYKNGHKKKLTIQEYSLIVYLLKHKGEAISKDDLLKHCEYEVIERKMLKLYIHNLRRKLNLHALVTIYGYGYKWK